MQTLYEKNNKTIFQIENILDLDKLDLLKKVIRDFEKKGGFVFNSNYWSIDLTNNTYLQELSDFIKNKFNFNTTLNCYNIECKLQSYGNIDKYHINVPDSDIDNLENYYTIALNIYLDNNKFLNDCCDISKNEVINNLVHSKYSKFNKKEIYNTYKDILINSSHRCINTLNTAYDNIVKTNVDVTDYILHYLSEKQNALDIQGYLYILPPNEMAVIGIENIDNNCIMYPSYFLSKSKYNFRFSNENKITLFFYYIKV